ncbi:MAG: hypothetical protein AAF702_03355 [Chloroflexota bacterium]
MSIQAVGALDLEIATVHDGLPIGLLLDEFDSRLIETLRLL